METSDTPFTQLKEYDTLSRLFSTIPKHVKSSMFGSRQEFSWTSISVSEKFIAIGTNVGVVFVYDRMKGAILHELSYQEKPDGVSCVRLISRVDDSIAVGHVSGVVVIYHLPSIITNGRKMRAFFVKDSHESHVTCLQWSLNAMKLFSGDSMGLVVCTEIDYESFTSRSFLVCRESHSIVQLDYSFQTLLVSTLSRSFLCHLDSSNEIIQIGQTERKCNGKFGAVFLPGMHNIHEASVFASRPGLRVWKATSRGTVESTLLFRDQITETSLRIMLQRDVVLENSPTSPSEERQFGCILLYGASCLLTYSGSSLYFVDRDVAAIICYHSNVGPILDVAVFGDEVYVLRKFTHRPLLRLSSRPVFDHIITVRDKVAPAQVSVLSPMTPESTSVSDSMPSIRSLGLKAVKMKGGFVSALKEVGDKVQKLPVQSLMQMPFVGKTTMQSPAKNDVVASNHASGSETVKLVQVSTMDDVDGVAEQRFLTETSHGNIICGALVDSQPSGLSDVRDQVVLDSDIVVPVVVQFPSSELCDWLNISGKFSSHNSGDSQGNNSVISENDSEVTRLGVNYGLAGRSDARVTVEKQSDDFVRNLNTQWDDSSSSALYSASGTASVPDSAQRVFRLSPEEDTLDIVFSSKRNSAKRIKKQVSKQNSNSSKSVDTVSIASAESIESERRVNITSFPSAELSLASTVEQPMAASSNSNDSALSTLVSSIDLDIDLGLLRNDQPILDFVPIPLLKSEILEKSLHPATHVGSEEVGDTIIPSSREILQDSSANGSVVKQTAKIWRQSSSEDDFYSVYRSNKKTPVTMGGFSATHKLIETRSASAVDNVVGSKLASSKTSDLGNGEVGPPCNSIGMSNQPSVEPVFVFDTDPLNTGNAMPDGARNIPFSRGISVDFDRPPCSLVTGTSCYMMADLWVLMPAPANILSIAVSTRYVWCVDHTGHMFYSALHGPGLQWFSVTTATAQQIRVSPSGSLIWRIDGGSVYAASGVTAKRQPWGTKWLEVARDVASISVDETVAWYVKIGGDVYMQKGLSRERPGYRAIRIESTIEMVQVVCRGGVVWGLTADRIIVVRLGINSMKEEGTDWAYLKKSGPGVMIASFDLSDDGTAWAVDVVGRLWFTTDVTPSKPRGSGLWWQVSLDQMNDPEATKALQLQPLSKLIGTDYGGLVSAGCNGVWLCPRYRDVLHICRGSFVGHRWQLVIPGGMWLSTKWKCVHPSSSQNDPSGAVWLVQSNGAMFCMAHNAADGTAQLFEVAPPEFDSHTVSIGANSGLLWCLLENGHVFIRKGIQRRCRQGLEWQRVNMLQLDQRDEKLCQVSVGIQSIWALSTSGIIYFRLGVTQPPPPYNPAWVPVVDDEKHPIVFSGISTSTDDKVIWAIGRDHQVFARSGVCDDLLFGTHWSLVPTGCKMQQLACSNSAVYSVDIAGQPYVRLGIEVKNTQGLSWHKIPGAMKKVAVTPDDELWGINDDAQLFQQYVFSLQRKSVLENLVKRDKDSSFEDAEWILV